MSHSSGTGLWTVENGTLIRDRCVDSIEWHTHLGPVCGHYRMSHSSWTGVWTVKNGTLIWDRCVDGTEWHTHPGSVCGHYRMSHSSGTGLWTVQNGTLIRDRSVDSAEWHTHLGPLCGQFQLPHLSGTFGIYSISSKLYIQKLCHCVRLSRLRNSRFIPSYQMTSEQSLVYREAICLLQCRDCSINCES